MLFSSETFILLILFNVVHKTIITAKLVPNLDCFTVNLLKHVKKLKSRPPGNKANPI